MNDTRVSIAMRRSRMLQPPGSYRSEGKDSWDSKRHEQGWQADTDWAGTWREWNGGPWHNGKCYYWSCRVSSVSDGEIWSGVNGSNIEALICASGCF
jgi:hypothetical protein